MGSCVVEIRDVDVRGIHAFSVWNYLINADWRFYMELCESIVFYKYIFLIKLWVCTENLYWKNVRMQTNCQFTKSVYLLSDIFLL